MRSAYRLLAWVAVALMPASAAFAASPSVSPIGDMTINAGSALTVNVVAVDTDNDPITLIAAVPAFGVLNAPSTGNGIVVTTMTLSPQAADVGTINASLTATAGGGADTETFTITVAAAGSDQAPVVTAPGSETVTEGQMLTFTVTGADPDGNSTTTLAATGTPTGAQFSTTGDVISTTGTFTWTPAAGQAGQYDVVFTGTNALTGSNVTHITVLGTDNGPVTIAPIADVTLAEGDSLTVNVSVTDPDSGTVDLTSSLPAFATLNPPITETGQGTLATTIKIKPGTGTAGTYNASVTATTDGETATEAFTITVTGTTANFETHATMIGNFNAHRKSICFRIRQTDAAFDLKNVDRSSVALHWNGTTLNPSSTKLEDCDDEDDDNCGDCDSLGVEHHGDDAAARLSANGDDDDDCEHGDCNDDDQGDDEDGDDCVEGLRACFATSALMDFFGDTGVSAGLNEATIEGHLTTGETFVATIGAVKVVPPHKGDDHKKSPLALRVKPNPLNPKADISFTLTQPGRVTIAIYDLRGRLVRTVLNENRAAGSQSVAWNGFDASERRVASGTYFVRIEAAQGQEMRSITVLK